MTPRRRRPLILANSKMNLTIGRANAYLDLFLPEFRAPQDREVVFAVPFTVLSTLRQRVGGRPIGVAAQNLFWEDEGPYTGEISAPMLSELGVTYVLVGHSERRMHLWEDDRMAHAKIRAALRHRLRPVLCVGEAEEIRVAGSAKSRVRDQIAMALDGVKPDSAPQLVVAYEPIWAIGTGRAASPADAGEMHAVIRTELRHLLGERAEEVRILYGGSVTPGNIDALMARPEIDGVLVGGASLKPEEFLRIVGFLPLRS
jgi:triosephosphate isomerase